MYSDPDRTPRPTPRSCLQHKGRHFISGSQLALQFEEVHIHVRSFCMSCVLDQTRLDSFAVSPRGDSTYYTCGAYYRNTRKWVGMGGAQSSYGRWCLFLSFLSIRSLTSFKLTTVCVIVKIIVNIASVTHSSSFFTTMVWPSITVLRD